MFNENKLFNNEHFFIIIKNQIKFFFSLVQLVS